jgi:hypothetical protein
LARYQKTVVEFQDSTGESFSLSLSTNQFIEVQEQAAGQIGRKWQRFLFHQALRHGSEVQKDITVEDAGDIQDDIGFARCRELVDQTKFGRNVKLEQEQDVAEREAEREKRDKPLREAIQQLTDRIVALEGKP